MVSNAREPRFHKQKDVYCFKMAAGVEINWLPIVDIFCGNNPSYIITDRYSSGIFYVFCVLCLCEAPPHWFIHQSSWQSSIWRKINSLAAATGICFIIIIIILSPFRFTYVSFPSLYDCLVRAGSVLTGSWWGVRRDANSHNLSLGADRLVARKFIQRVLSLHLPYFEVALSTLACRTWLCVHHPPSSHPLKRVWKKEMEHSCVSIPMYVFLLSECVFVCVCVWVFEWKREGRRGRRGRGRDAACQSILALENSRSFFHVLPTIGQSVSNQSGA